MRSWELVRFAVGAIIAHPMRSALTSLGVVIGVAAVVMMTSIGLGASKRVTDTIAGLGSNLIIVQPNFQRGGGFVSGGAGQGLTLRDSDVEAITKRLPMYSRDGRFSREGAETAYTVLKAFDPEVANAKIDVAATYTDAFIDKALSK